MTDKRIIHLMSVSSTQDEARKLVLREAEPEGRACPIGTVIVADTQESGRGRRNREWVSPTGGLYTSIIMKNDTHLPLRVGVAVARALREWSIDALLKWPNDVIVSERKIAGILIEAMSDRAIVGIGVNIEHAPLTTATCANDETASSGTRDELLAAILHEIEKTYEIDVIDTYRALCTTLGRDVTVTVGDETMAGRVHGIDRSGALVLKTDDKTRIINSGECNHVETLSAWRDPAEVLG